MPLVCAVESCRAFAAPESHFCPGHEHAKRLQSVFSGRTCTKCRKVLHAGDYVTVESTADKMTHAQCPDPEARKARASSSSTPLFDESSGQ